MADTHLVTFNCPKKVLEDFDKTVKRVGRYKDRTHALIVAMEFFIEENKEEAKDVP